MTSREKLEYMIRHYSDDVEKMKRIDLEIKRYIPMTHEEAIEMLSFPGKREDHVMVQHDTDSDQLMRIALSYRSLCWHMNQEQLQDWSDEYNPLARQVAFLEHAIGRLPRKQRELMTTMVLEGKGWTETCEKLKISGASITKLRSRALGHMALTFEDYAKIYDFQESDFGGANDD